MLEFPNLLSLYLDLDAASRLDILGKDQVDHILYLISQTEQRSAVIYAQFHVLENHFQQALSYGRRYDKEGGRHFIKLQQLSNFSGDFAGAVIMAEEAYELCCCSLQSKSSTGADSVLIECLARWVVSKIQRINSINRVRQWSEYILTWGVCFINYLEIYRELNC